GDFGVTGFDLIVPVESSDALTDALVDFGVVVVEPDTAAVARIEAGQPQFGVDMDVETIPLEAGIEDRAISLTKGCYVGQEIIIRMLHRGGGRVARRLVMLQIGKADALANAVDDSAAAPIAGTALIDDSGATVGTLTS